MDYEQDGLSFISDNLLLQKVYVWVGLRCTFGLASCGFLHVPVTHNGDTCVRSALRTLSYPGFVEYRTWFVEYLLECPVYLVGTILFRWQ
jgi:hypothetical protein